MSGGERDPRPSWSPPAADPFVALGDEGRTAEAVRARAEERELRRFAAETATFAGTLRDLAEGATEVTVRTATDRSYQGALVAVAIDHLVLRSPLASLVHIAIDQVTAVQPDRDVVAPVAAGEREAAEGRTLDEVLLEAVEDRPVVALVTRGDGSVHRGQLLAVGEDIVSLRVAEVGTVRYVPTSAISEVVAG